jgi:ubiquitin C-terminal hydrolase
MFGLRNHRGSCWVNATLQSIFRIPEFQGHYTGDKDVSHYNAVEKSLEEIWMTDGDEGLMKFYKSIKTPLLPAGESIGDSHELLEAICDKVPFLDKLFRFKIANVVKCKHCDYSSTKFDSLIEFSIAPTKSKQSVSDAIMEAVRPQEIAEWKCEKCGKQGCTKQMMLSSFPQVLTFHMTSLDTSVSYSSILNVNGNKYALFSVVCFNGGHWWAYARDMPPGRPWHELDDTQVRPKDANHFPLSDNMRLLMYYRLNE